MKIKERNEGNERKSKRGRGREGEENSAAL
jgi:hypothetical protein